MRERVRAVLLTPDGRMVTIRRVRPGMPVYWVLPGGGVEPDDTSLEAALVREIREELGGRATVHGLITTLDDPEGVQHVYLAHIESWSETDRTGLEFADPTRGSYQVDLVPFTSNGVAGIDLKPDALVQTLAVRLSTITTPGDLLVSVEDQ